jgi:hypothetical protein
MEEHQNAMFFSLFFVPRMKAKGNVSIRNAQFGLIRYNDEEHDDMLATT